MTDQQDRITCPTCDGVGVTEPPDLPANLPSAVCYRCKGTGTIPVVMLEWIKTGLAMREDRCERWTGLRTEAARRGMSLTRLSAMEQGLIEPEAAS